MADSHNVEPVTIVDPDVPNKPGLSQSKVRVIAAMAISATVALIIILSISLTTRRNVQITATPRPTVKKPTEGDTMTTAWPGTTPSTSTEKMTTEARNYSMNCDRECVAGDVRNCLFEWDVFYYHSITKKPCKNCPFNPEECSRDKCIPLNGFSRTVVTVNGQIPGPKIIVCKNDKIIVKVHNELEDMTGITFHWHGITQVGTGVMDGVSMVTQCPIVFGTSFTYEFNAYPAGTHLWHSHLGSNRADGLAGAVIVRDADDVHKDLYDTDDSNHIIFVQDWMYVTQIDNFIGFLYNKGENSPDFILINGKGRGVAFVKDNVTYYTPREVFTVVQNKRHRFRLISNGFTGCPLKVTFDNHTVTAIAGDGASFYPVEVNSVVLYAGERFDIIYKADQEIDNYFIRVEGIGNSCANEKRQLREFAIVRYENAPTADPVASEDSTIFDEGVVLHPSPLHPFDESVTFDDLKATDVHEPDITVKTYYIPIGVGKPAKAEGHPFLRKGIPQMGYISFAHPPVPLLTQHNEVKDDFFCDVEDTQSWDHCVTENCRCAHTITGRVNETIELVFYNGTNTTTTKGCHPIHLHGYTFRVVGSGLMDEHVSPTEFKALDVDGAFPRNMENATLKDTVCVAHGTYVIIRFVANNLGWWFMHCHLDFHALLGMAMVVRVGTYEEIQTQIPDDFPRCNSWSL